MAATYALEENPVQTSSIHQPLEDPQRMNASEVQRRITQLAAEIRLEIDRKRDFKKNNDADKKGNKEKETDKTLKRLSYHERSNKNKHRSELNKF